MINLVMPGAWHSVNTIIPQKVSGSYFSWMPIYSSNETWAIPANLYACPVTCENVSSYYPDYLPKCIS